MRRALVAAVMLCFLPLPLAVGGPGGPREKAAAGGGRASQSRTFYLLVPGGGGLDVGLERAFVRLKTGSDRWLREPSWLDDRAVSIRDMLLAPVDADPLGEQAEPPVEYVPGEDLWLAFSAGRPIDAAELSARQDADMAAAFFAEPESEEDGAAADGRAAGDPSHAGAQQAPSGGAAPAAQGGGPDGIVAVAGVICLTIFLPAGVGLVLLRRVRRQ
jgi:hypothetical protein